MSKPDRTRPAQRLFAVPETAVCGKVQATADDYPYRFELVCHLPAEHEGACRVLGWTEAR